jgi:hypothetical protein
VINQVTLIKVKWPAYLYLYLLRRGYRRTRLLVHRITLVLAELLVPMFFSHDYSDFPLEEASNTQKMIDLAPEMVKVFRKLLTLMVELD